MDTDLQRASRDVPFSPAHGRVGNAFVGELSAHPVACTLCRRALSPDIDEVEPIGICGDCKFLLLEDLGASTQNYRRRRHNRGRRLRYRSSDSAGNLFSQQMSHMINQVRQNQFSTSAHEDPSLDGDASTLFAQRTSARTTPSGSRRWRRVLSDTESEGYDNLDSVYGESETNGRDRAFHGESDAVSFSLYGGDSDASVDGHSFVDTEMFIQPDEASIINSDTDIDPMHAGLSQWESEDTEEDEDDEEDEWEEADVEEETAESVETGTGIQNFLISSPNEGNGPINWLRVLRASENERLTYWGNRQVRRAYIRDMIANLEALELAHRNYLDARGFEEFLERLAEIDSSRRGAPPAAASFVKNLPLVTINSEHKKNDDIACAICKDVLSIGTEVNQLPCLHLYHPSCILPWLGTRNSCPLCRLELPTDDKNYEEGKSNAYGGMRIRHADEDASSYVSEGDGADEAHEYRQGGTELMNNLEMDGGTVSSNRDNNRSRWFFLAAAPIVSLVGIVLVLWLGNPQGRRSSRHSNLAEGALNQIPTSTPLPDPRGNRSRRWWYLF